MVHIAIDIGASSGRLVMGEFKDDKLEIKEIHRFSNGFENNCGTLYWDVDHLFNEILIGLQLVKKLGHKKCTIGIDTWAVDYVLVNKEGNRLKEVVSYRDNRTEKAIDNLTKRVSKEDIYHKTGIQFLPFNTLYQLSVEDDEILAETDKILLVPDYLVYRLTGKAIMETTNASTTQLLNINKHEFDEDLLQKLGLRRDQFPQLVEPGHKIGMVKNDWYPEFDLPTCQVITVASHDTASAVVGTPSTVDNWAYVSSGTWSLLGIETHQPIVNSLALERNYTNEWGAFNTYRFLKNIMGMWIIQEVRRCLTEPFDFSELIEAAHKVKPFQQYINFNDDRFLNPHNMIVEIQSYCQETNQPIPRSPGELAVCVFGNLAIIYAIAMEELEELTNHKIDRLYIVGGGGRNELLNQLTADLSNKTVFVGPTEATAIGNIVIQLMTTDKISSLAEGRQIIADSFGLTKFYPTDFNRATIIQQYQDLTSK